ncbi:MAG TPA: hypothetical protein VKX28_10110 [Xanthobacteraceae bacterium]|jgi:hypothetical protein|nr:hypothetical protein [Xanthobacteraceae bacterium]
MSRIQLAVASIFFGVFALLGASDRSAAQAGCQPTITQPCTNTPARSSNPAPNQRRSVQADDDNTPKDHSPHIKLDNDTEFKFGTQGIGLGRKF